MANELDRVDRERVGAIVVSSDKSALAFENVGAMMDFAKLMAVSDKAVRPHLRNNPGACLAIVVQASEWRMSPFAVASKSYVVGDQIAYESQLIHAVVEMRAPLKERLRVSYEGEGPTRKAFITGHFKNEVDPVVYESPMVKDIRVKNSPLWASDPDQQLFYFASRAWARRYAPDVILGIYSEDELEDRHVGADHAKNVTPGTPEAQDLHYRLTNSAIKRAGFDVGEVNKVIDGAVAKRDAPKEDPPPVPPVQAAAETAPADSPLPPVADAAGAVEQADVSASKTSSLPSGQAGDAERPDQTEGEVSHASPSDEIPSESAPAAPAPVSEEKPPMVAYQEAGEPGPPFNGTYKDGKPVNNPVEKPAAAPKYTPPVAPKDGPDYVRYVGEMLKIPGMDDEIEVRRWYSSPYQKKLRNALLNITPEIIAEAQSLAVAHIKSLKKETPNESIPSNTSD